MISPLGMLFDNLPWRSQKTISEAHSRIVHKLMMSFRKIIDESLSSLRGIRGSWTGWTRIHEKVKHEIVRDLRSQFISFPSFFNRLIRWW